MGEAGAGCVACGDCCDPVWFPLGPADVRQGAVTARRGEDRANLEFAARHWRATGARGDDGRYGYRCDRFDSRTRRCTAHEERPPVCRGYPWYGGSPAPGEPDLPPRCSHRLDIPGARPLLPLLPVAAATAALRRGSPRA